MINGQIVIHGTANKEIGCYSVKVFANWFL